MRTATCSCGQLSVTVTGEPFEVWACHCLECQKQTGSPYSLTAGWSRSAIVETRGEAKSWSRASYRNRVIENVFCPVCASIVYSYSGASPDAVMIAVGNFADTAFPPPTVEYWTEHRHPWVEVKSATVRWKRQEEDGEKG